MADSRGGCRYVIFAGQTKSRQLALTAES